MYKISNTVILFIKGSGHGLKEKIAKAAGVSTSTVYRWILENSDNLTKASVLMLLKKETGLEENQILEQVPKGKGSKVIV